MSSADTEAPETTDDETPASDELREGVLAEFREALGEGLLESHLQPGHDLWIRVDRARWVETAEAAKRHGFAFFEFLSAIDWMPAPYGRYEDAAVDQVARIDEPEPADAAAFEVGYAGGETRFQVFARLYDLQRHVGVIIKVDLPEDALHLPTWVRIYPGADWHERETHEMFGVVFDGHPYLEHLYLPSGFEGHPLRKDYPLLARVVKPWPGIVDVEPMPDEADEPTDDEAQGGDDA